MKTSETFPGGQKFAFGQERLDFSAGLWHAGAKPRFQGISEGKAWELATPSPHSQLLLGPRWLKPRHQQKFLGILSCNNY